ncbi:UNVERIFIED_CONTAM: hypothetical protein H355_013665 [Colinus virginianus]|nr:hypothetical protein H355_013665 [Colinus virginianus]
MTVQRLPQAVCYYAEQRPSFNKGLDKNEEGVVTTDKCITGVCMAKKERMKGNLTSSPFLSFFWTRGRMRELKCLICQEQWWQRKSTYENAHFILDTLTVEFFKSYSAVSELHTADAEAIDCSVIRFLTLIALLTTQGATPPTHEVDTLDRGACGTTGDGSETTQTQPVGPPAAATASFALPGSKAEALMSGTSADYSAICAAVFKDENPLHDMDLNPPDDCESVVMKNGVRYRGEWKNGKQHGRGVQTQPDGVRYTGQFACGHIEGFGRLERPDGSKYEGEFHEGKAHTTSRSGVYTFADGSKYIGQWVMDKRHGVGKEITVEGSVYEGQFKNGCKHGHGRMKSPNGDVYEGDFSRGDMNGVRVKWLDDEEEEDAGEKRVDTRPSGKFERKAEPQQTRSTYDEITPKVQEAP